MIKHNNVEESQVQADIIEWSGVRRGEAAFERIRDQPKEQHGADNHVRDVQAGHTKIKREEKLRVSIGGDVGAGLELERKAGDVVLDVLVVIFLRPHAEKDAAQEQRERETKSNQLLLSNLGAPHAHRHGQAAGDQDDSVEAAKLQV